MRPRKWNYDHTMTPVLVWSFLFVANLDLLPLKSSQEDFFFLQRLQYMKKVNSYEKITGVLIGKVRELPRALGECECLCLG